MSLPDLLKLRRSGILDRWQKMIVETYPADAANFMRRQKDRFHNPVGHSITEATSLLFDAMLGGGAAEEVDGALDGIIRVRAVQDFSAAQAVAFVFQLKRAIREELGETVSTGELSNELFRIEAAIDNMGLTAFDVYMRCRERVHDVRAHEMRRRTSRLMELVERTALRAGNGEKPAGGDDHKEGE